MLQDTDELAEEQMTLQSLTMAVTEQDDVDAIEDAEDSSDCDVDFVEALGSVEVGWSSSLLPSVGTRLSPIEIVGKLFTPGNGGGKGGG